MSGPKESAASLLEVHDLSVHFGEAQRARWSWWHTERSLLRAVDGVSLSVGKGEIVGLVGESGSGKTTLGRAILGMYPIAGGEVLFAGSDVSRMSRNDRRLLRRRMQMIPQDAAASLSPRFSVSQLLTEAYDISGTAPAARKPTSELLSMVELGHEHANKYPHELSGGQARRVSIARALAMGPDFIVADEPTAGLDVSAVATIVNLLMRLRTDLGLSYLVITHDLQVVAYLADVIAVMYLGKIVEIGRAEDIIDSPKHPYTRSLLHSISGRAAAERAMFELKGEVPNPLTPPSGCRFHPRCSFARPLCRTQEPLRTECGKNHETACHFWNKIEATLDPANGRINSKENTP
ncbi:ABC transporter ATP-binding protein [Phyllobacterium sp. SB3]|uniref:ABC transporter ATP-binding protein n=1 Tax=Phyllobacterium sp. SB3 TaxID=3156073 RepID=UPI0032AF4FF4